MGLDNGIILKTKNKIENIPEYIKISEINYDNDKNFYSYDICYWRKCWNIRNKIFIIAKNSVDGGIGELTISDIETIKNILFEFLCNGENWDGSIWEFGEMIPQLAQDIVNLSWLTNYLKNNSKSYSYFYDSY